VLCLHLSPKQQVEVYGLLLPVELQCGRVDAMSESMQSVVTVRKDLLSNLVLEVAVYTLVAELCCINLQDVIVHEAAWCVVCHQPLSSSCDVFSTGVCI
jgi:hypothetical protein